MLHAATCEPRWSIDSSSDFVCLSPVSRRRNKNRMYQQDSSTYPSFATSLNGECQYCGSHTFSGRRKIVRERAAGITRRPRGRPKSSTLKQKSNCLVVDLQRSNEPISDNGPQIQPDIFGDGNRKEGRTSVSSQPRRLQSSQRLERPPQTTDGGNLIINQNLGLIFPYLSSYPAQERQRLYQLRDHCKNASQ